MSNYLMTMLSNQYFLIIMIILAVIIMMMLLISHIKLSKKLKILSQNFFSLQRNIDHKETLLENALSKLAQNLPLNQHSKTIETNLSENLTHTLNQFSVRLNKQIQKELEESQNIWHDKFSILLNVLGKKEKDIISERDHLFKNSWTSISELRQKSQLLFNDMREDGIFYRIQSLLFLSNIEITQSNYADALRHVIAGLKLYNDSKPSLPLSQKLIWKLVDNMLLCMNHLEQDKIKNILNKFNIDPNQILHLCVELENFESDVELLQKIRLWYNHLEK